MPASEACVRVEWDAASEHWPGADGCLTAAGCRAGGSGGGGAGSSCAHS